MLRKEPRNTEAPHINIQSPQKTSQHIKFSHKKKYCGIKDIRVLFYSSIFQMIIVFLFIVLKYFSFCCHSSHSVLCCNRLVYSCFILIVKSDSKLILNSSCQLSILFNLFVIHLWLQPVFFIPCLYSYYFSCYFVFVHSVFPVTLSFLFILSSRLLCLYIYFYVILSLYYFVFIHSVFLVTLSLCHSISLCHSVSFHLFVALPLLYFSFHFQLSFYGFISLFFDIFV